MSSETFAEFLSRKNTAIRSLVRMAGHKPRGSRHRVASAAPRAYGGVRSPEADFSRTDPVKRRREELKLKTKDSKEVPGLCAP